MAGTPSPVAESTEQEPKKFKSLWKNITVEPICFSFLFANSFSESIISTLVLQKTCSMTLGYNKTTCDKLHTGTAEAYELEEVVQLYASSLILNRSLLTSILASVVVFFLGPWCDNYGRRPIIMLPIIGYTLQFVLILLFTIFSSIPPQYLLVVSLPLPLCGGMMTCITMSYAYIADITRGKEERIRYAYVEASSHIGSILGTFLSPIAFNSVGRYGYVLVFSLCITLNVMCLLYVYFFLPETIDPNKGVKSFNISYLAKLMKEAVSTNFKKRPNRRKFIVLSCISSLGINFVAIDCFAHVSYLFSRLRFGWDIPQFSLWSASREIMAALGCIFYLLVFSKRLKVHDGFSVILAFSLRLVQFIILVCVPSNAEYLMYIASVIGIMSTASTPITISILSRSVEKEELGKVSLLGAVMSIAPLAGSPVYTAIYQSTLTYFPGAMFLYAVTLQLINIFLFIPVYYFLIKYPDPFKDYSKE